MLFAVLGSGLALLFVPSRALSADWAAMLGYLAGSLCLLVLSRVLLRRPAARLQAKSGRASQAPYEVANASTGMMLLQDTLPLVVSLTVVFAELRAGVPFWRVRELSWDDAKTGGVLLFTGLVFVLLRRWRTCSPAA